MSESLLNQVRDLLSTRPDVSEQRSIGGSRTFTVAGNMLGGVGKTGLMVRVGPERYDWALTQPHITPMVMGSKRPIGYVYVGEQALADDDALALWIGHALRFVLTLPSQGIRNLPLAFIIR